MSLERVDALLRAAEARADLPLDLGDIERVYHCRASAAYPPCWQRPVGGADLVKRFYGQRQAALSAALRAGADAALITRAATTPLRLPNKPLRNISLAAFRDYRIERFSDRPPPGCVITATADLIWSEPEPLWFDRRGQPRVPEGSGLVVGELQLEHGGGYRQPLLNHALLSTGALVARHLDAPAVTFASVMFTAEHYRRLYADSALGREDIRVAEMELRRMAAEVELCRQRIDDGLSPHATAGWYCTDCPAGWACPQHIRYMREAILAGPPRSGETLSQAEAASLVETLAATRAASERILSALKLHVHHYGPIPLSRPDEYWGPRSQRKAILRGGHALELLKRRVGEALAQQAVSLSEDKVRDAFLRARQDGIIRDDPHEAWLSYIGELASEGLLESSHHTSYIIHEHDDADTSGLEPA